MKLEPNIINTDYCIIFSGDCFHMCQHSVEISQHTITKEFIVSEYINRFVFSENRISFEQDCYAKGECVYPEGEKRTLSKELYDSIFRICDMICYKNKLISNVLWQKCRPSEHGNEYSYGKDSEFALSFGEHHSITFYKKEREDWYCVGQFSSWFNYFSVRNTLMSVKPDDDESTLLSYVLYFDRHSAYVEMDDDTYSLLYFDDIVNILKLDLKSLYNIVLLIFVNLSID